ncbi:hypothetical protein R69927_06557 [Paraburkholderia domus]|jgi:hypothetical protein|uniref:Uncharacterized protein n=1 Tax=Paraburkholderia domus TaxID=2793075 RepID=A0A9N8NE61_9BURK|nr:hypothetical protein R75483_04172 [Paraburkholderia domus]CAE6820581.1 hypothetical protein R69749_03508 [Paraburkholderia domus]CAE6841031.1 hypothetical protein R70006_07110 [Paraburkholderia domus]CAE6920868.1 hypothetical protein R69927_06557 [Paraburkholderia domus]CAE6958556.1 hypothetical protein R70199_07137 [Paraburkholderia domus]
MIATSLLRKRSELLLLVKNSSGSGKLKIANMGSRVLFFR